MSAWSRIQLGWDVPTEITSDGTYQVYDAGAVSCPTCVQIFKISHGMPASEYLLIENREPTGFESDKVNHKGLIIYHIDDSTGHNTQGYPGQADWPSNGNHYVSFCFLCVIVEISSRTMSQLIMFVSLFLQRVAILPADGDYDLEKNVNRGDIGDYWTQGQELLPSIDVNSGPFPNTDSYKGGNVVQTGVRITDISASGTVMSFQVTGISQGGTSSPSKSPETSPTLPPGSTILLACGSTAGSCKQSATNEPTREADPTESHEVRCCSESSTNPGGWNQYTSGNCPSNIWGESDFSNNVGCVHSATYYEAQQICSIAGGRLCTVAELLADCTRGSGCSHDSDYIWSSDSASTESPSKTVSLISQKKDTQKDTSQFMQKRNKLTLMFCSLSFSHIHLSANI